MLSSDLAPKVGTVFTSNTKLRVAVLPFASVAKKLILCAPKSATEGVQLICEVGIVLNAVGNAGDMFAPAGIEPDVILVFTDGSGFLAATLSMCNTFERITAPLPSALVGEIN